VQRFRAERDQYAPGCAGTWRVEGVASMINLFIDSNVFLSFYHLTNEDLEELRKIIALIDTKQIKLFLTKQVHNEFARNRGNKIVDGMKKLQEARFNLSFPAFAKDYRQYEQLRFFLKRADDKHAELIKKITDDARAAELNADKIISELFGKATLIDSADDLCYRALMRVRLATHLAKNIP
jgi:predicted nucleic acid-binding protein